MMGIPLRVLVVEDSEDDAALLLLELRRGGYDVIHERVDTAPAMTGALDKQEWDLVVSDHSMPHFSGSAALNLLREKESEVPFIFISGTMGEEAAVAALKDGAQDYLMKSNLTRLVPAVQRELREASERQEHKRLERQVLQLQKFEAIGRLAGGIAHDFNNAMGAILGWADLARQEAPPGSRLQDRLGKICAQAQRAAGLTSQLLAFARQQVLQRRKINLNSLVEEGTSLLRKVIGEDIDVRIVPAADLRVAVADAVQIDQVLMNLCLNARDAMPKGGRLVIETHNIEFDQEYCRLHTYVQPGSYVLLSVSDTGVGMDPATIEHIFEPFFTTKEVGKGTGLGLATVFGIVKQHGGFINVYSEPGKGTTFRVYLPSDSGSAEPLRSEVPELPQKGTETILLAEDHEGLRELGQETLEALGYQVILATNGTEAVALFKNNVARIDAVVVDVVMPGMSGPDAYAEMCTIRPGLGVVFATGYTAEAASLTSLVAKGASVLQKPYTATSLSKAIRHVLESNSSKVSR
jgi:two-component system, cell cycle sensor histidine kinase and response regulator CckA